MDDISRLPDKENYQEPYPYPFPLSKIGLVLILISVVIIPIVYPTISPILVESRVISALIIALIVYLVAILNLYPHEWLHAKVLSLIGYNPEINVNWIWANGYVSTPGQFVDANHNIISLLAPLTVLNSIYLLFLVTELHWMISVLFSGLLFLNSVASSADVYGAYFDSKLPDGSKVYFPESGEKKSYIYEPVSD